MVVITEEEHLAHYGILRRSGRYPWGSGGTQNARNRSFLDTISELKKQGLSDVEICRGFGMSTTELRAAKTIARAEQKQSQRLMAQRLQAKGMSNGAIAERMGLPGESSVRALTAEGAADKADALMETARVIKEAVDSKRFVDVGDGVSNHLNIPQTRLNAAVAILKEQGYQVHPVPIPQLGTKFDTRGKVLVPPGVTQKEAWENRAKLQQIGSWSEDGGHHFGKVHDPISVNPNRLMIKYREDGGDKSDGMIFVREGVPDLSLGKARYAQVRVQVGEGHYLKGMAMYKENLPPGVDLVFHADKTSTGNKLDALKPLKGDKDLPFGSVVRQILADPGTPHERNTSAMNIVNEEVNWEKWSRNLSAQFLSKQSPALARTQLKITRDRRKAELDEIMALTNPTVKKLLLEKFADSTDSASQHLKAATFRNANWYAILPIETMHPTQIYAPNYKNGDRVVLVRYPHGGTFEIPELVVNNNHAEAKKLLGDAKAAVGIHHSVAKHLSGADFDGDTILVIPNHSGRVKVSTPLEGLKNFDPKAAYPKYEGMPKLSSTRKQQLMGDVSNLITDMTLKSAPHSELVRAIRHSMVVIDAETHDLNYKESAKVNGIAELKKKYQGRSTAGAATLISRKKSYDVVPERRLRRQSEGGSIDEHGRLVFVESGRTRKTKSGERIAKTEKVNRLSATHDAHTLVSGTPTPMERLYADHSNSLKEMANQARLAAKKTPSLKYSASAKQHYAKEVASLDAKLSLSKQNRPLERQAQVIAGAVVRAKRQANPDLSPETIKKLNFQELERARARTGANKKKKRVEITADEWTAIQAGAISNHQLEEILTNTDIEAVKALATPRRQLLMSPSNTARARVLLDQGNTRAEVAARLGVSLTTLDAATNE